jgi:hypothetical protein
MTWNRIRSTIQTPHGKTGALVALVCVVGIGAFVLGRVSVGVPLSNGTEGSAAAWCAVAPVLGVQQQEDSAIHDSSTVVEARQQGGYVASRSGSVYHLPWCSGAQRIKAENAVWFATKEAAEQAGYRAAQNCPGI